MSEAERAHDFYYQFLAAYRAALSDSEAAPPIGLSSPRPRALRSLFLLHDAVVRPGSTLRPD
jgi:hypothetical protein